MKTLCDTAPNRLQNIDTRTAPIPPADRSDHFYRRILVGTDFTDASACAFAQALKLAQQNGAELLVAHVATAPNCLSFIPPEAYDQWVEESRAEVQKNMSALMQQASDAGVKAHRLWLEGLADDALIKTARRLGVDLIVVGTHQHRFFMSSIATHVVLRAPCAVLTAR